MRRLAIHLAIALATFMIGTTTTLPFHSQPEVKSLKDTMHRASVDEELIKRVFQLEIEQPSTFLPKTYYLSCYNYDDPSEKVMAYLSSRNLSLRVRRLSELDRDDDTYLRVRVFVRVGSINWISDTEVIVGGSYAVNPDNTKAHIYHFVREAGWWRLVSSETIT